MHRHGPLGLLALVLAASCQPACRAWRTRFHRAPTSVHARATHSGNANASRTAAPTHVGPHAVTVRIGRPGANLPLPMDAMIEPDALRLVVDSPYQSWSDEGTFVHVVAYTPDGRPCPDAYVYSGEQDIGRTDAHGSFAFRRVPDREHDAHSDENGPTRLTVICRAGERTYLGVAGYGAYARTSSFEQPVVYVYTDRGVYNPGQTLHARAIAWRLRGEYEPVSSQNVTLSLRREDGSSLGGGALQTDVYGTGALDIGLPEHLEEGRYTLVATIGEETAEAQIRIQRFVPPVLRIEHTLGEFLTPAMRDLPFDLNVHYFDGATFTRGHVVVSAVVGEQQIPVAARDILGEGPHAFSVPAAVLSRVRERLDDGERFDVRIDVTDPTGRNDTLRRSLRIAANPYTVTIELDRQGYAPGERVDATVRIVDLNHVVVRGKHVELRGLDARLQGDTADDGVVHFRFPMPRRGVEISAWVPDVGEAVATTTLAITSVHPMQSTVAQTTLRERQPVDVTVRFPANVVPVEDVVHADVVDSSGSIIDSMLVPIDRTGAEPIGRLRFDAPSWGSMLLTLFTTAAPRDAARDARSIGLVTDGQNIPVTPGSTIDITLDPLPSEARPGDRVHVSARITREGAPIDARVGAAVVDQAVISLLDPLEHDPRDRFYNPQQKVLAETGAQTLTWPVVQRTWGDDRYDIGWPSAFGFHGGANADQTEWQMPGSDHVTTTPIRLGTLLDAARRRQQENDGGIVSPFGALSEGSLETAMNGNMIGDAFGYCGLGATGTGWGGGGTGEGTIGLGSIGTLGRGAEPSRTPRLVLRTDFSETAAWLPSLEAHAGHLAFDVDLPDSITRQQVSLVATDRHGGLAVTRVEIPVRQPFYVRSDLPPALVENDALVVALAARDLADAPTHATLALTSDDLRVEPVGPSEVDVPSHGVASTSFRVTALHPGRATYHFTAIGGGLEDRGERTLFVQPLGTPVNTVDDATVDANGAYALTFDDTGSHYAVHTVSIAIPTAVALGDVLAASDRVIGRDAESLAAELDVAISLLELPALSAPSASTRAIREHAARSLLALLASQNHDGGFGWWWNAPSDVGVTSFTVDVLSRAYRANLPVPLPALDRSAEFLTHALSAGRSLASARSIATWEGNGTRIRAVLTAQAVAALANLPLSQQDDDVRAAVHAAHETLASLARNASSSPLEVAFALRALHLAHAADAGHGGGAHADTNVANEDAAAVSRLLAVRHERHWEPGWFDAFGGGIETTAIALEALRESGAPRADAIEHDAAEYLLATRSEWGAWHNVRGTAWAVRALTRLSIGSERDGAHVHAEIDGRVVADVTIDPHDPWASTLALRDIELTDLVPGVHHLTVRYDGALRADVHVSHARWGASAPPVSAAATTLSILAPRSARTDAPVEIGFRWSHLSPTRALRVSVPIPPYGDPDAASLRALVANGTLAGFHIESRSIECIVVDPLPDGAVRFGVRVPRAGHFTLTGARARVDGPSPIEGLPASLDVL